MNKHPSIEDSRKAWTRQLSTSTGALKRCTRSIKRAEWHETQIEEAEHFLSQINEVEQLKEELKS